MNDIEPATGLRARLAGVVPIFRWLPRYDRSRLGGDLAAGAIVGALLIPQSLGYARIAGVPVEVGLYAVPLALLAYAVLGSSPQLIVGPASTVAIVSGSLVADIAADNPEDTVAITSALAIAAGLVLIATGLLRIAWVAEFLSKPIVTGFVFGLTLTIVIGELPTLLGIPKPKGDLLGVFVRTIRDLAEFHGPTAIVGGGALVLLFGGRRFAPRIPWGLVVLIVAVVASRVLDLAAEGVRTIGDVPAGLPPFALPIVPRDDLGAVVVGGVSLALVALAEGLAATRLFATRGGYRVETERELVGMGAANIGAGLTGGLGVAGSLSKTAAAEQSGSTSQVSGMTAAGLVVVVLLAFTWFFEDLPQAVLSAIVVVAVWGLMDVAAMRRYREVRQADFVAGTVAVAGVVLFGPLPGLGIAIVTSLLAIIYRSSAPRMEVLGRISGEKAAWGRLRGHTSRREVAGIIVVRLDAPLFWANASAIEDRLLDEVQRRPRTRALVLDLEATSQLDTTSADVLEHLLHELDQVGVRLYLARVIHPVSSVLKRSGFLAALGDGRMWHSISQCVRAARRETGLKGKRKDAVDEVAIEEVAVKEVAVDEVALVGVAAEISRDEDERDVRENEPKTELAGESDQADEEDEVEILDDPSATTEDDLYAGGAEPEGARDRVVDFYLAAMRDGRPRQACDALVGDHLVQHGRGLDGGRDGFIERCEDFVAAHHDRYVYVARTIEDGPMVFLHVLQSLDGGAEQLVTAEFFAVDADDLIVEHWRVAAPYESSSWSERTSIDGPTDIGALGRTAGNKAIVRQLIQEVLGPEGDRSRLAEFVAPSCIEHGAAPLGSSDEADVRDEILLLVGEGNFVATLCSVRHRDTERMHADVFRVEYGKLVEHWCVADELPARGEPRRDPAR